MMKTDNLKPGDEILCWLLMRWDTVRCKEVYRLVKCQVRGVSETQICAEYHLYGRKCYEWIVRENRIVLPAPQ